MNVAQNLERTALHFPEQWAVIDGTSRVTYGELDRLAGCAAAGLRALGVCPGDPVAIASPNAIQWAAFYFGVLKAGAVAVTLSSQLAADEFRLLVAHCRPKVLFTSQERLTHVAALDPEARPTHLICPGADLDFSRLLALGVEPLQALERDRADTAAVLYTGGTTGLPKGVMLSHENINTAILNVVSQERSGKSDRALCFLPFNHVFGQMHIMNATVLSGGGLVLLPRFDLEAVLKAIADHGVTKLFGVPTVYVRILQARGLKASLGTVRYCFSAAASMARELVIEWEGRTGLKIHESYGMTETASMVTYNHYYRHKVGSVGTPVGTSEVSIRDPLGRWVPLGAVGEICVRGRNVMKGYLDNEEDTREAFRGDWLRSGDLGYVDQEGYLFIVDRLKDMIITGGENVYPREVEELLHARPEVSECAVIGLPDEEYGERVTAFIVPRPGAHVDPAALKVYLKDHISPFKVPKAFVTVEQLPTSPAGKILKRELKRAVLSDPP